MQEPSQQQESLQATPASDTAAEQAMPPLLKLAIEFGPLMVFFITQRKYDLMTATWVFMIAISIALVVSWIVQRKLPTVPLITAVFVLVMGGLTLYLDNEVFIKTKPTLVNTLFAGLLLGGLARGKLFLKMVFKDAFQMEDEGWKRLTIRFGVWFLVLAVVNEVVHRNFSEDTWVNFKVFGLTVLSVVFMLAQMPLMQRYEIPGPESEPKSS